MRTNGESPNNNCIILFVATQTMSTRASEAAKAVNTMLEFTEDDQQSLQDYFTLPDGTGQDGDSDDDSDVDDDLHTLEGTMNNNSTHTNN